MILIDANILLYAYDASSPQHKRARVWLEQALSGEDDVRIALLSLLAFLRISTNPAVFERPLQPEDAIEIVRSWLAQPGVGVAEPSGRHWTVLAGLAQAGRARGPLLMDAHLAALAMEHGSMLCTTDRDFARFPQLRFRDPLGA
ncbi:MAG: type II toxin-antitoxin system VapC family toxin [Actinomycetota bacterium]|nr:type II toxin-antitoxin system VapC family toxin [Actinomycetota bacterium]